MSGKRVGTLTLEGDTVAPTPATGCDFHADKFTSEIINAHH